MLTSHRTLLLTVIGLAVSSLAQAEDKTKPAKRLDVRYIPADAVAAVVIHPRQILTAPGMELLPLEVFSAQSMKTLGIDPLNVEQVILFSKAPTGPVPEFGIIARFAKPIDAKQAMAKIGRIPPGLSAFAANDRTLLVAAKKTLDSMREFDEADSPLLKRLRAANVAHHATLVLSVEAVRPMLTLALAGLPPLPEPLAELPDLPARVSAVEIHLDVGDRMHNEIVLHANNAESAAAVERTLNTALKFGKELALAQIAQFAQQPENKDDPVQQAVAQYGRRMTNVLFDSIKPTRDKDRLAVAVSFKGDVATVGVLTALLLPAVQAAREAARQNTSRNNMKNIALAMIIHDNERRRYPAQASVDKNGKKLLSWRVHILPYLEQKALYDKFRLDEPWDSEHNKKLIPLMPAVYRNPNLALYDKTNYLVPVGAGTVFGGRGMTSDDLKDRLSNTILVVEADADEAVIWTKPDDLNVTAKDPLAGLGHLRPRIFLAAFADTHVAPIEQTIRPKWLWAMFTAAADD